MDFIPTIVKATATGALGAAGNTAELGEALYALPHRRLIERFRTVP
jgi:hypothetical protein